MFVPHNSKLLLIVYGNVVPLLMTFMWECLSHHLSFVICWDLVMTDGNSTEELVFPTLLFVLTTIQQHTVHLWCNYCGEFSLCKVPCLVLAYLCWLLADAWQHKTLLRPLSLPENKRQKQLVQSECWASAIMCWQHPNWVV